MTLSFSFQIPDKPKSMGRVRFATDKKTTYVDTNTRKAKEKISRIAREVMQAKGFSPFEHEAVQLACSFYFQRGKRRRKGEEAERKVSRPDVDNLMKLVMDALNGVVYRDDSQVVMLSGLKAEHDDEPFTDVQVIVYNN